MRLTEKNLKKQKKSVHELLTMSSIIEKEATENVDRKTIASVFYNRLDEKMRLQTDPTVLYALGKHKSRTLYKDLKVESPYNTYLNNACRQVLFLIAGNRLLKQRFTLLKQITCIS